MTIGLILAIVIALIVVGLILMKKKPTPPPPPTPPPIPPPPETVKIDVCATSGLIPNPYCPQIVSREFEKGKEPTTQCGIHKKPDPPPPPPPPKPDRAPFYVGTSVYEEMEFPEEEIDYFLETGYSNGMNITEIFASYSWSRGASIQPYLLVGDLFDYTKENPVYWNRLRHIMTRCAPPDLDNALIIRIFDGCSIKDDADYEKLVWHHSIQKRDWQDVQHKAWGGFYGTTATDGKGPRPYYSAFVNRIRAIALETGCVVIFHAMNEPGYNPTKGEVENWIGRILPQGQANWNLTAKEQATILDHKDRIILEFHQWLYSVIKFKIVNPDLRMTRTVNWARNNGLWIEVHGCNSPERMIQAISNGGIANGDGPDPFAQGRQGDKPEKREPSVPQGEKMGQLGRSHKVPYLIVFNRKTENPMPPDLRRAEFDVLRAMIKGARNQ